ncbi:MAG: threonine synthase [Deltaproteobacteria bacterium]|nr:threonine synthase [Deltaproteobacteria bacterium]MBW2053959.1 threonine synthase [Deltaproteobacteria bacterium]MBW2140778.1 threonine synthase [Deltaproteobacteria bacterium]MBW2323586.1 threonine synthase [Deltaproteobacteria bacterium]
MKFEDFPSEIKPDLLPSPSGHLVYHCLGCGCEYEIDSLLYTCPDCGKVFLIQDLEQDRLAKRTGARWRQIFDYRKMLNLPALKGVFLFHEFLAPVIPLEDVVYLGEGHTPVVAGNQELTEMVGTEFYFKNDGLNPSASFKDRGMAAATSYLKFLAREKGLPEILSVCASTGDTSAAAALYAAYLSGILKSAVLLPHGKVTPQQLSQPLGSGARVFELPGVFDDCMKVVEHLADNYDVALLNSKNAWRVLGQESYAFEIAQGFDYEVKALSLFVPIGNAGNITSVLSGLLKFERFGIIDGLPRVFGVQSTHANPVFRYYAEPPEKRRFEAVVVRPSVAQAAMIGNPVSMPRVLKLVQEYEERAGEPRFFVVQVDEQSIMDSMLLANRNGHVACTQGGESMAGLRQALTQGLIKPGDKAILDSTAHFLKFSEFQTTYFENRFSPDFEITSQPELINRPSYVAPEGLDRLPEPGVKLDPEDFKAFVQSAAKEIARVLGLKPKKN